MTDQQTDGIVLVTENRHHEHPDVWKAFDTFEKAIEYISQYDIDETDLTRYTSPGGEHLGANIGERRSVSIREIEVD